MAASRTIIVAGAGIGGLTAALALAAKGFRVVILEKAERLEEAGAGLQLSPNASRVLIELGLEPRLGEAAIVPEAVTVMSGPAGHPIVRLPLGAAATERAGAPYWVIHRADLQTALAERVRAHPLIELRLGCHFAEVASHADGVSVSGRRGTMQLQEPALAMIGADGIWSAVRGQIFPAAQPHFSGLVAWRATAPLKPGIENVREVQLWMGPGAHLVVYPISGGRRLNLVGIVRGDWSRQGWSAPGEPADIKAAFAHWSAEAQGVIGRAERWKRWALFAMPDGGIWNNGATALLGDAAHGMLPFAAQGAGMAIEDAAVLAKCLGDIAATSSGNASAVPAALRRYAAERRNRVARVQRLARQNGAIYHFSGAAALARDVAMRLIGGRRLLARQDWVYDWQL